MLKSEHRLLSKSSPFLENRHSLPTTLLPAVMTLLPLGIWRILGLCHSVGLVLPHFFQKVQYILERFATRAGVLAMIAGVLSALKARRNS